MSLWCCDILWCFKFNLASALTDGFAHFVTILCQINLPICSPAPKFKIYFNVICKDNIEEHYEPAPDLNCHLKKALFKLEAAVLLLILLLLLIQADRLTSPWMLTQPWYCIRLYSLKNFVQCSELLNITLTFPIKLMEMVSKDWWVLTWNTHFRYYNYHWLLLLMYNKIFNYSRTTFDCLHLPLTPTVTISGSLEAGRSLHSQNVYL